MEICQCECKKVQKKQNCCNPSKCICENGKYFKSIVDESIIMCNEIISVRNSTANVTNALPVNSDDKKVRCKMDYHILQTVLLVHILLFLITCVCFHYSNRSKQNVLRY